MKKRKGKPGLWFKCPYCGKEFKSKRDLINHICKKHKKGMCR